MFPSQPQIGQDMARERRELAARIRQAKEASAANRASLAVNQQGTPALQAMRDRRLIGLWARLRARFG